MKGLRRRLARGAVGAFVVNGAGVGIAFLAQVVAARALGVESYGVFSFVLAWVLLLASVANLGTEMGLVRFAAPYHDQQDLPRLRGVIQFAEQYVLWAGLGIAAIGMLAFGLGIGGEAVSQELRWTFLLGLVGVPLLALLRARLSVVRAFGKVAEALVPDKVARESVFILILLALMLVQPSSLTAPLAGGAMSIGAAVGLVMITYFSRRAAPPALSSVTPLADERGTWWQTAWPLWLLSLSQLAMRRMDVVVLGILIGTQASGVFFACFVAAQSIVFPLVAVSFLFSPTIAALHAKGDRAGLQEAVTTTSWWTTLGAIAFGVPLMVLAPQLLALFGPEFAQHANVLRILVLGQLVTAASGATMSFLTMAGGERHALSISLVAFACKLVLLLVLTPLIGILGAAVADATFRAGWNIALAITMWRRLGIVPSVFNSFRRHGNAYPTGPEPPAAAIGGEKLNA